MSVVHGSSVADALLELPAPSTKSTTAEFPATVWLTVGLLATDGLALQVGARPKTAQSMGSPVYRAPLTLR